MPRSQTTFSQPRMYTPRRGTTILGQSTTVMMIMMITMMIRITMSLM
jgi:hypothetical protein